MLGENGVIHDAIKHVDSSMNSYRELMPARPYVEPPAQHKISPLDRDLLGQLFTAERMADASGKRCDKYLLEQISGFSPLLCRSICEAADVAPDTRINLLSSDDTSALCHVLLAVCEEIEKHRYRPAILLEGGENDYLPPIPKDMHCLSVVKRPAHTEKIQRLQKSVIGAGPLPP